MSFNENNFEKLRFNPFGFGNVLLNDTNAPDENIFHNLSQIDSVFYVFEEAATSLKKINDKTFSVLHLNVRSLNQNFESLKELQTTIEFDYKAIFFTEMWCTADPTNQTFFNLENYISINHVRKHGSGGGICLFIHNFLTFKLRSDLRTNSDDIESLAIEIINKKTKMLSLVHRSDKQLVILNNMKHFFNKMKNSNKVKYTVNDTNLNLIDCETNIKVKHFLNLFFQKSYSCHK